MKVSVRSTSGEWYVAERADNAEHVESFLVVTDSNGDKLLSVALRVIEAVLYDYSDE